MRKNDTPPALAPSATQSPEGLGQRVREIRKARGWKLSDLAERTGLAISTISKMERNEISLTYDRFMRLAQGLGLDVGELFDPDAEGFERGAVSVTRAGQAPLHETRNYAYEMLGSDLTGKHMIPMAGTIKAHERADFADFVSHPGEEFLMLLEGSLEVHIAGHDTTTLAPGDSMYFDSGLGHVYVSAGDSDARILVVCWKPGK
jgi:transcriptional regulator with XRE-family HTH domain